MSRSAACAMFTAWSPTRSRSLETLIALTMKRRSRAIGCWSASSSSAAASISISIVSSSLVGRDHRLRLPLVLREQRVDRQLDERLRLLRHVEQPAVERRELVVKMAEPVVSVGLIRISR